MHEAPELDLFGVVQALSEPMRVEIVHQLRERGVAIPVGTSA
ncbi:hypothetical protein [Streptomyces pinistramenti]|nr:hypothetical protein [Streptomyces pinistramenti]